MEVTRMENNEKKEALERVKKAVTPLSFRQRNTRG